MPSYVAPCKSFGPVGDEDLELLYHLLSAFAHGRSWSRHATERGPSSPTRVPGLLTGSISAHERVLAGATELVARLARAAVGDFEGYVGAR